MTSTSRRQPHDPGLSFDDRARAATRSLLTDATRVPSTMTRERARSTPQSAPASAPKSAPWKVITVFAATVLVISGAVVGASVAVRSGSAVKPVPASAPGHWKSFQLPPVGSSLAAVSCSAVTYCVAVAYGGEWFTSTDPGGGSRAWKLCIGRPGQRRSRRGR